MTPEQKLVGLKDLVSEHNSIPFVSREKGGMGREELENWRARIWLNICLLVEANTTCVICGGVYKVGDRHACPED